MGTPGEREPAPAADARPVRPPDRRGGVPPGLARADAHRRRARPGGGALAGGGRGRRPRPRPARRRLPGLDAGRDGSRLPHDHDLRRRPRAAPGPGARGPLRARPHRGGVPVRAGRADGQAGPGRRHGHDREAGRLRRPGQHHPRRPPGRRDLPADRAQVVHLGADERPVPRARGARRGGVVLPRPAGAARRRAQRVPRATSQGQARRPVERLERGGVRRHDGLAGGRTGTRGVGDHRDGHHDPPGLRARVGGDGARGPDPGEPPRPAPVGLRCAAGRPAAHAERAGRPRGRERGGHGPGHPAGRGPGRRGDGVPAARDRGGEVLGVQADAGRRRRGDGGARRERLRRGLGPPAALPAVAAELDLGGLGQRHRAGRPAGPGALVGVAGGRHRRDRAGARCGRAVRRRGDWGAVLGTLPAATDVASLVRRSAVGPPG